MMAVVNDTEPTFSPGTPVALFDGPYRLGERNRFHAVDISPDGERFLMIKQAEATGESSPIIVVQNWFEELTRLVPEE